MSKFWLIVVNILFLVGFLSIFLAIIWNSNEIAIIAVVSIMSSAIIGIKMDDRC
ncbi:MAG: hypothetical protein ACW990_00235 [Promethearchaeota archaeon]|jgi:hypothetical protein